MKLIKYENCEFTRKGLVLSEDITKEEWMKIGEGLHFVKESAQIWIGDWARFGERKGFYTDTKTYDEIEKATGYNRKTIRNFKYVAEKIPSSLRKDDLTFSHYEQVAPLDFEKQEKLLNLASEEKLSYRELRKEVRKEKHPIKEIELPEGKFNVIYADPPWKYDHSRTVARDIENQYPTMDLDDICDLKVPSADNAVLFLWATAPKLQEALAVMNSWDFTYRTCGIWDKEIIGMGYWFRGQHELLLVGTRGKFNAPDESIRQSSVHKEKRCMHSKKPDYYYNLIERYFPNGKYLELFARSQYNEKWTIYGNE